MVIMGSAGCTDMDRELSELLRQLGHPKLLVVGDIMLDRYTFGFAERISQEAPVPVLRVDRHDDRLGGAASVASMLVCLEAEVVLAGVIGTDASAQIVVELLRHWGLHTNLVLPDPDRPTTYKERFIGRAQDRHPQQILRVDREVQAPLSSYMEVALLEKLDEQIRWCDVLLVSDYDKGVCTPSLLRQIIDRAQKCGKRVLVDPLRGTDYARYRGSSCLTPNRSETAQATGLPVATAEQALVAGEALLAQLGAEAVVVTLDREGMALAHRDGRRRQFPTRARQVYDVTGAGDMVLSVLGLCLASGTDYGAAIALSNVAAGLEVEQLGVATVSREDLLRELAPTRSIKSDKVRALDALLDELNQRRRQGQVVVFTNGCFDVLHLGHIQCLRAARSFGDILVVGLNSDASVRQLKGPQRPLNGVVARAEVLSALADVDYIILFDGDTPLSMLSAIRPHVLVKGGDYRPDQVIGREVVEAAGGRVVIVPFVPGHSTTRMVQQFPEIARNTNGIFETD